MVRDFARSGSPRRGHPLRLEGRPAEPFLYQASRPVPGRSPAGPGPGAAAVEIVDRCEAVGLATSTRRDRVTGVRILQRAAGCRGERPSTPTSSSTRPDAAAAPRRGWRRSATSSRRRNGSRSTSSTPLDTCGCARAHSAAEVHRHRCRAGPAHRLRAVRAGGGPVDPDGDRVRCAPPADRPRTASSASSRPSPRPTSSPRSATPSRSTTSSPTGSRPTSAGATTGCVSFPAGLPRLRRRDLQLQPVVRPRHVDRRAAGGRAAGRAGDGDRDLAGRFFRAAAETDDHGVAADCRRRPGPAPGAGATAAAGPGHQRLRRPGAERRPSATPWWPSSSSGSPPSRTRPRGCSGPPSRFASSAPTSTAGPRRRQQARRRACTCHSGWPVATSPDGGADGSEAGECLAELVEVGRRPRRAGCAPGSRRPATRRRNASAGNRATAASGVTASRGVSVTAGSRARR